MTSRLYMFAALACLAMFASGCGDPSDSSDASPSTTASALASATGIAAEASPSSTPDAPTETPIATATPLPTRSAPTLAPSPASAPVPATLDFNTMPSDPWFRQYDSGTATVSNGILTIDAPAGYNEFEMSIDGNGPHPADPWTANVSNVRGWWVEVKMRVDPLTEPYCAGLPPGQSPRGPALTVWATDDTHKLVQLGFAPACVAWIKGPADATTFSLDTTAAFHVYRISVLLNEVSIYVDGAKVMTGDTSTLGETNTGLIFGDGQTALGPTRSYWDYLTYDTSGPGP